MDHSLKRGQCDDCHLWYYLDSMMRLEICGGRDGPQLLDMTLCYRCRVIETDWWMERRPDAYRYYHPA